MTAVLAALLLSAAVEGAPLDLAALHRRAAEADPRVRQLALEARETELRLRSLEAEKRPTLTLEGQVQYQSDVVRIPAAPVPGAGPAGPPRETFDAHLGVEQRLLDPTRRARAETERARLAEAQARVQTALFALREEVNEAFFTAALLQEREGQVDTSIRDLEARLDEARLRVDEGVSLPGEAAALEAAALRRRQDRAELRAARRAALGRLSDLVGRTIGLEEPLLVPDLGAQAADARGRIDALRARPEFQQFARARERLVAQKEGVLARERPRVSAFGRAGVGRPGLDFVSDEVNPYWLAGVRVQWSPWSWGTARREREVLAAQQESLLAEEEAFARRVRRLTERDAATIDQLRETSALDDRIVLLHETIERERLARFRERAVTAADYVDAQTDVLEARLRRAARRVELAQAEARLLTLLGLEVR